MKRNEMIDFDEYAERQAQWDAYCEKNNSYIEQIIKTLKANEKHNKSGFDVLSTNPDFYD